MRNSCRDAAEGGATDTHTLNDGGGGCDGGGGGSLPAAKLQDNKLVTLTTHRKRARSTRDNTRCQEPRKRPQTTSKCQIQL